MKIGDGAPALFTGDIIGDKVHRAGAVQGNHHDNVFNIGRFQLNQVSFHARRFKLENADGLSLFKQLESPGIGGGNFVNVNFLAGGFGYDFQGRFNDGQVFKAQKVHFKKTKVFYRMKGVLGNVGVVVGGSVLDRYVVIQP